MDQFSGDIAAMLEIALIGAGLVVLYYGGKEGSKLMKAGACLMLIGGFLGLACTGYWWFKYHSIGVFDNPRVSTVNLVHHDGDTKHHFFPKE
ncbi:MAG: hypothetical protein HND56_00600 [Pseudomonadota bacterium]|nr:hypothetical protein [Pseudomonadota bacterium]QKK04268.1 MAG: hypothetical protein HND56_00600 [Pseudomonadota bacterium]